MWSEFVDIGYVLCDIIYMFWFVRELSFWKSINIVWVFMIYCEIEFCRLVLEGGRGGFRIIYVFLIEFGLGNVGKLEVIIGYYFCI